MAGAALETDFDSDDSLDQAMAVLEAGERLTETEMRALMLGKAAASSPARITPRVAERYAARLPAQAIVELLVWLGVLQMLYRIDRFYR